VADKSTQMVLGALSRAAAEPAGLPLHGTRSAPGLFPTTAAGRLAAQRCKDEGYLHVLAPDPSAVDGPGATAATATRRKQAAEVCTLTDKGRAYLLGQVSPRQVLEDFVRVLEARQTQAAELLAAARQMQAGFEALRASAEKVLGQLSDAAHKRDGEPGAGHHTPLNGMFQQFIGQSASSLRDPLLAHLARWHASGATEDCPLPELFRGLQPQAAGLTIGHFHDELRRLHDAEQIYLHPWTGPLYDVPEPPYALLVGHEVAYYASLRN
jgi:hypothetical protein